MVGRGGGGDNVRVVEARMDMQCAIVRSIRTRIGAAVTKFGGENR